MSLLTHDSVMQQYLWLHHACVIVCTSSKNLCYEIIAELIYSVYSHPQFSIYSFCVYKRTQIALLRDRASVALYSPNPLLHTSRHSHTHSLLSLLSCFCRAGTGTDWLRSLKAGSSLCHPPLRSSASPKTLPSLQCVTYLLDFFTKPCFYTIKTNLDTFTVLSDYINPEVHWGGKESNHGCIMLYKSADNAGCTK